VPKSVPRETVVITGGTVGVGRATARAFARRGARIGILARGREGLDSTLRDIEDQGGEGLAIPTDVAEGDQVEAAAEEIEKTFGPIDIWVNNAMTAVFAPVKETTPEEFRRVTEVTYLGVVNGTVAALKRMLPRNRGVIVQVGSALSERSIPLQASYCGAKHAVRGFTDSLRCELYHDKSNVHVTMVQFPALNTPQFGWVRSKLDRKPQPVPPIFQPEVAADAIVYAAHHNRREIIVGGSTLQAMWGNKFIAGLLDRYLGLTGYDAQQTEEPEDPNRPDGLWSPVPGDHGAHGSFDSRAKSRSIQWELNRNRGRIGLGALALGTAAGVAGVMMRQR